MRIWELVDGERTVHEIFQIVCQEFDAEEQRVKKDLLKFLKHLKSTGAIQFAHNSAGKEESGKPKTEREALRLSIGGVGFSLQWEEPREVNWPHPLYEPFIGEESDTIHLEIHFEGGPKLNGQKLIFDGDHHWKLYQQDSRYLFEAFDPSNQTTNMVSLIHPHFDRAEVYVKPESSGSPSAWSLLRLMNPLGQWLLVNRLAQTGGVMVHALGIDDGGQGRVFVGPSGAGKSTLAQFWRRRKGVRILSDEHLILRRRGRRFYAYGTPWPGMAASVSRDPVEIQQIFFIEHHPEHRLWGETQGTLASNLFAQLFLPRWNEGIIESGVTACEQLVQGVECQRLGFAKDPSVIDFVRQLKGGIR